MTSGFVNGMRVQGTEPTDARIVFYGAGSSAVGVADAIAMYSVQVSGWLGDLHEILGGRGLVLCLRCQQLGCRYRAICQALDLHLPDVAEWQFGDLEWRHESTAGKGWGWAW